MSEYIAVSCDGDVNVHLPDADVGSHATLCGLDGADENPHVNQKVVSLPKGAKVDCDRCRSVWNLCMTYKNGDFK